MTIRKTLTDFLLRTVASRFEAIAPEPANDTEKPLADPRSNSQPQKTMAQSLLSPEYSASQTPSSPIPGRMGRRRRRYR